MIVFEWFYDKNEIIETELKQLEYYKVFSLQLFLVHTHNYTLYMQYVATGSCCEELNNGGGCLLSCKTAREESV